MRLPKINSERWLSTENLYNEEWRPVVGFEGNYEVSSYGRVKSFITNSKHKKPHILHVLFKKQNGYTAIAFHHKRKTKQELLHRVVAAAFLGGYHEGLEIDHINTIRTDNRLINLRWVTRKENHLNPLSRVHHSLANLGKKHTEEQNERSSLAHIGKGMSIENGFAREVFQLDDEFNIIKRWGCITDAARYLGLKSIGNIVSCCKGNRQHSGGYRWSYTI